MNIESILSKLIVIIKAPIILKAIKKNYNRNVYIFKAYLPLSVLNFEIITEPLNF